MLKLRAHRLISCLVVISLLLSSWPMPLDAEAAGPSPARPGDTASLAFGPAAMPPAQAVAVPESLQAPLSVTRSQSAAVPGAAISNTLVLTLTVSNNQSLGALPDIAPGATITEALDTLGGFDVVDDPNTLRDVVVVDTLLNGATLIASDPPADRNGARLLVNVGDIPPLSDASVVLTLTVPASVSDLTPLDDGATAYGSRQGRPVAAAAPPAALHPDSFAQWLIWTQDADTRDPALLRELGLLGGDALDLFAFVQSLGFEAYEGSLRGTRGTLWSAAGNSLDQSSLLIALLRAAGTPARYRHGALGVADAQMLTVSMFPEPAVLRGDVPAGTEVSDPANDPDLLAEVGDHWWVEAYLPGSGWTDLDPSFATTAPGDVLATPAGDGTDRIAEVPDALRHKVAIQLTAEKYYSFPQGGLNLQRSVPLTATLNSVQAAGRPVNVGFSVETTVPLGLVFAAVDHVYTPYVGIADSSTLILGEPLQDLLTNFPLATHYVTGLWLQVDLIAPDGAAERYERTLKDLIGPDLRLNGGEAQLPARDESPLIGQNEIAQLHVVANSGIPRDALTRQLSNILAQGPALDASEAALTALLAQEEPEADEIVTTVEAAWPAILTAQESTMAWLGAYYQYATTNAARPIGAESLLVKSYPDRPKLLLLTQTGIDAEAMQTTFELLNIHERAIAYPGQATSAAAGATLVRTMNDKGIEYEIMRNLVPGELRSGYGTLLAAFEQEAPMRVIQAATVGELADLAIPDDTKALVAALAVEGQTVLVPEEMVSMAYGPDIGFLAIDAEGNARFGDQSGHNAAAAVEKGVFSVKIAVEVFIKSTSAGFLGGMIAYIVTFSIQAVGLLLGITETRLNEALGEFIGATTGKDTLIQLIILAQETLGLVVGACSQSPNPPACSGGAGAGYLIVVSGIAGGIAGGGLDPSLPAFYFGDAPEPTPEPFATGTVTPTLMPATNVSVDVAAGHVRLAGGLETAWQGTAYHGLAGTTLAADNATLYRAGTSLGSGALLAHEASLTIGGSGLDWSLESQGSVGGYAAATDGLAFGRDLAYTATLAAGLPYTATIAAGAVYLGGVAQGNGTPADPFTGVITGSAVLAGATGGPAPSFQTGAILTTTAAGIQLGDIQSGTLLADGMPLGSLETLAVTGFTGSVGVTESGPGSDQIAFAGPAGFFGLQATASAASVAPGETLVVTPTVITNLPGAFGLVVEAPAGWEVGVSPSGLITATASPSAGAGSHAMLVTASSPAYPGLYASALVSVTLDAAHAVQVSLVADPLITIPMGEILDESPDVPFTLNHVADGRPEVTGAAYVVRVLNDSTATHTFDIAVTGLPAGWTVLSGVGASPTTAVTLSAGEAAELGLYVVPETPVLPVAGTNYPFTVTATDQGAPAVSDSAGGEFTMPGAGFPLMSAVPGEQFATPGEPVTITVGLRNVGNAASTFPVTMTLRQGWSSSRPVSPTLVTSPEALLTGVLTPAADFATVVNLTTTGTLPGDTFFLRAQSEAGEYYPAAFAAVRITSPEVAAVYESAACLADSLLAETARSLAESLSLLLGSCTAGSCDPLLRDEAVAATDGYLLALTAGIPAIDAGPVEVARDSLASAADDTAIAIAVAGLGTALATTNAAACEWGEHGPAARLTPALTAALTGASAPYTLTVTNEGTLTTTYDITMALPAGDSLATISLAPGASTTIGYGVSAEAPGIYPLQATVVATGTGVIGDVRAVAHAGINVVDRFVQVTAVTADPAFVDVGTSSTDLAVTVANVANMPLDATARLTVTDPGGDLKAAVDVPLSLLAGNPRAYDLTTLDTSGWTEGVYTITVDLLCTGDLCAPPALVPDGRGTGYLGVGQLLGADHAVAPALVPPGTVTVTTIITTAILAETIIPPALRPLGWPATGLRVPESGSHVVEESEGRVDGESRSRPDQPVNRPTDQLTDEPTSQPTTYLTALGYTRTENGDPAISYAGNWLPITGIPASGSNVHRSNTLGSTATYTFTGQTVIVGFMADNQSGLADIYLDGVLQTTVDLYRRPQDIASYRFDVAPGTHVISVTVLDQRNPLSGNDWVYLDYVDVWDGTLSPGGHFEQDDPGVLLSSQWGTVFDPLASGGSYLRHTINNNSSLWYPFTGDSISLGVFRSTNTNFVDVRVDGEQKGYYDIAAFDKMTDTINLTNLGPGLHVLEVRSWIGYPAVDFFDIPALGLETPPNPTAAYRRTESFEPEIRFNGLPFDETASSWSHVAVGGGAEASRASYVQSETAGDTFAYDFDGEWISIGFVSDIGGGIAQIVIDGVDQGDVDLYTRDPGRFSRSFAVGPGSHTITVTVTGNQNPFANDNEIAVDYIDVWDGTPLTPGAVEAESNPRLLSGYWSLSTHALASGGRYLEPTLFVNRPSAWFPFEGDSVSIEYLRNNGGNVEFDVFIDGVFQRHVDGDNPTIVSDTVSFDGLGPGLHVLQVSGYRQEAWIDRFIAPATTPADPPACGSYCRIEENDPAVRYNGADPRGAPRTWTFSLDSVPRILANDWYAWSGTPGDTVSLVFTGTQVAVGFWGTRDAGDVAVNIDGVSQGTVDTYRRGESLVTAVYAGLAPGPHTITLTVAGTGHPNSLNQRVQIDYFDVWDGTPLSDGTFEVEERHVRSYGWTELSDPVASGGTYWQTNSNTDSAMWLPFNGDSIELGVIGGHQGDPYARVTVDGAYVATINLWSPTIVTRTYAFGGFGPGTHLLEVQTDRDRVAIDTFTTPAAGPFFTDPAFTGLVRYDVDHPAMRYDGWPWAQRAGNWLRAEATNFGNRLAARTSTAASVASLTFAGAWASVGLEQQSNQGVAEIFVDGQSYAVIDLGDPENRIVDVPVTGLITGTHTISVAVVSGEVHLDHIDVYDGAPVADALTDAWLADLASEGRVHFTGALSGRFDPSAIGGRAMVAGLAQGEAVWFTFLGDSVTFYAFSDNDSNIGASVYIDGQFKETMSLDYDFTDSTLAFHYSDLGPGPHVMQVLDVRSMRVDGFVTPATNVPWVPLVEWSDDEGAGNGAPFFGTVGMAASFAVGDVTGDGQVEIVVSADDLINAGTLFLYRGDGADTGDDDPILWSIPFGGGIYRTWVGSPGIAELDGQPGAEIVVNVGDELYALHADGTTYWVTDTVPAFEVMSSPAFANLDLDAEPEIVVNVGDRLYLFEHDGALTWEAAFANPVLPPVLADITGDGVPEIFATAWNDVVTLYEFNGGSPSILWQRTMSSTLAGMFGSPAVADVDGQQPGGDPGPEIIVSSNGRLTVLDADGSIVWSIALDPGNPGGVSAADLDGDGEIEIVVSMRWEGDPNGVGRLYALNADGSLLWSAPAYDDTSANVASVVDVNGDGIWEVAWNGRQQGFTLYNGADGTVLFNEPLVYSLTGTDYPIIADVDGDGAAEIVATSLRGIRVIGMDGVWGPARPLWNQHTYHITNVNDDLSVPFVEPESWAIHNTYRTQTSLISPLPVYAVAITHTVGITGVTVLSDTFNVPPGLAADPAYGWAYSQNYQTTTVTRTFQSQIQDLAPGETRLVAASTIVTYDLPGGQNRLLLPARYVSAARIVALAPAAQTIGAGGTATFTVTLTNPAAIPDVYTLATVGLPAEWTASLPPSVALGAGASTSVPLTVSLPQDALPGASDFAVTAINGAGGRDQAGATLTVVDALDLAVVPTARLAAAGSPASYVLTVTNRLAEPQDVALTAGGAPLFDLAASVAVPSGSSVAVPFTATGLNAGANPFAVTGSGALGGSASDTALLSVIGRLAVGVIVTPTIAVGGPGSQIPLTVTVSNPGGVAETYALDATLPAGWSHAFRVNGSPIGTVTVPAGGAATVLLSVQAPATAGAGDNLALVTASSLTAPALQASDAATVTLLAQGVEVAIQPAVDTVLSPLDSGSWQVEVNNAGSVADTFDLSVIGFFAGVASFSPPSVALNPGQSTLVTLTTDPVAYALPGTVDLIVRAVSQGDPRVRAADAQPVTLLGYEAVRVDWSPLTETVPLPQAVTFLLVLTNTGNLATDFDLDVDLGLVPGRAGATRLVLPAHATAWVPVRLQPVPAGTYALTATATSADAGDTATATLVVLDDPTAVRLALARTLPATRAPIWALAWLALSLATAWVWRRQDPPWRRRPGPG